MYDNITLANITGLTGAFLYANSVTNGVFAPLVIIMTFFIFTAIAYTTTKERSIAFGLFTSLIPSTLFVAAGVLDPLWLLVNFVTLCAAIFMLGRLNP